MTFKAGDKVTSGEKTAKAGDVFNVLAVKDWHDGTFALCEHATEHAERRWRNVKQLRLVVASDAAGAADAAGPQMRRDADADAK